MQLRLLRVVTMILISFYAVNVATQTCIFQILTLFISHLKTDYGVQFDFFKSVIPLHAFRYLHITPFRKF